MKKDPTEPYPSIATLVDALTTITRGDIRGQCPRTFFERCVAHGRARSGVGVLTLLGLAVFGFGLANGCALERIG